MAYEVVELGAGRVDEASGLPVVQGSTPISEDGNDAESFGELPLFYPIGFASLPATKTDSGWAEGFVVRDAAGMDGVMIGGRDSRAASIYGNLAAGDTAVFSTGPNLASQLLLKESTNQACLLTLDTTSKHMVFVLDGNEDEIKIAGMGQAIMISRDGITLGNSNGGITIASNGDVLINGRKIMLGPLATTLTPVGIGVGASTASATVFVNP